MSAFVSPIGARAPTPTRKLTPGAGGLTDTVECCRDSLAHRPSALIVDFDGTLSPIVPDPASAVILPECKTALARLVLQLDLVAVISGRAPDEAREKVALDGIEYFGVHGMEHWTPNGVEVAPGLQPFIDVVAQLLPELEDHVALPGVRIEAKGPAVAIHYRQAADPEATHQSLLEPLRHIARHAGLELLQGRMVMELRPPGHGKGGCLTYLAEQRGLSGVVYVGDDQTDEDAFRALRLWRRTEGRAGTTVAVASAEAPPTLLETADCTVLSVWQVGELLTALADASF
ncbi:MAG TPA: trehalose-phosphatase [Chloroflexota bacterium]|jgi:trehalose 6-phosphate phosphatase